MHTSAVVVIAHLMQHTYKNDYRLSRLCNENHVLMELRLHGLSQLLILNTYSIVAPTACRYRPRQWSSCLRQLFERCMFWPVLSSGCLPWHLVQRRSESCPVCQSTFLGSSLSWSGTPEPAMQELLCHAYISCRHIEPVACLFEKFYLYKTVFMLKKQKQSRRFLQHDKFPAATDTFFGTPDSCAEVSVYPLRLVVHLLSTKFLSLYIVHVTGDIRLGS